MYGSRCCALSLLLMLLTACSSLQSRPAASTYGCMQAVRGQLPAGLPDSRLHCLASAQIARQCSMGEAYLAGIGKELRDLFTAGDAEWSDWQADRAGVHCGRTYPTQEGIQACCAQQGF